MHKPSILSFSSPSLIAKSVQESSSAAIEVRFSLIHALAMRSLSISVIRRNSELDLESISFADQIRITLLRHASISVRNHWRNCGARVRCILENVAISHSIDSPGVAPRTCVATRATFSAMCPTPTLGPALLHGATSLCSCATWAGYKCTHPAKRSRDDGSEYLQKCEFENHADKELQFVEPLEKNQWRRNRTRAASISTYEQTLTSSLKPRPARPELRPIDTNYRKDPVSKASQTWRQPNAVVSERNPRDISQRRNSDSVKTTNNVDALGTATEFSKRKSAPLNECREIETVQQRRGTCQLMRDGTIQEQSSKYDGDAARKSTRLDGEKILDLRRSQGQARTLSLANSSSHWDQAATWRSRASSSGGGAGGRVVGAGGAKEDVQSRCDWDVRRAGSVRDSWRHGGGRGHEANRRARDLQCTLRRSERKWSAAGAGNPSLDDKRRDTAGAVEWRARGQDRRYGGSPRHHTHRVEVSVSAASGGGTAVSVQDGGRHGGEEDVAASNAKRPARLTTSSRHTRRDIGGDRGGRCGSAVAEQRRAEFVAPDGRSEGLSPGEGAPTHSPQQIPGAQSQRNARERVWLRRTLFGFAERTRRHSFKDPVKQSGVLNLWAIAVATAYGKLVESRVTEAASVARAKAVRACRDCGAGHAEVTSGGETRPRKTQRAHGTVAASGAGGAPAGR
ncbi:hypothetical protein C8R45DRAFT_1081476 [Mycena sanguinolenta]|nr:hypothetical protein C8R45DRAFT_1081476 [Mycena sanguinolenta]